MVSDGLQAFIDTLSEYEHSGIEMSPEGVTAIRLTLRGYMLEVRNMEDRLAQLDALSAPIFADRLAGNVLPFRRPS